MTDPMTDLVAVWSGLPVHGVRTVLGWTPRHPEFGDAVQEAWVALLAAADAYDSERASFPTYALVAIRHNLIAWRYRESRRGVKYGPQAGVGFGEFDAGEGEAIACPLPGPAEDVADDDEAAWLWRQVDVLPAPERTAVRMRVRYDSSYAAIGGRLRRSQVTAKKVYLGGVKRLRAGVAR